MMYFMVIVSVHVLLQASACPDPITTVHIQNHDGPIYVSPDRFSSDCQRNQGADNRVTSNQSPLHTSNQTPLLHPYHICETDCKCLTKQLSTCVPINTVPQNTCAGTGTCYSYPGCYGYYPEGYGTSYGYYPETQGSDTSPVVSEGLIPFLKSYIGQSKCPKHGCHCGQSYSSY